PINQKLNEVAKLEHLVPATPSLPSRPITISIKQTVETTNQGNQQEWHEILSEFFLKIQMIETNRVFQTELNVLSSEYEKQITKYLDRLLQELTLWRSKLEVNESISSIKRKNDQVDGSPIEENENPAKKIQKLMDPQIVQIKATNSEIEQKIDSFIDHKKSEINDSNRTEFLRKSSNPEDIISCARSDAAEINRNIQMKLDVVNNEDGPLARSTFSSAHQRNETNKISPAYLSSGVEERIQNIEKHLNVQIVTPVPLEVYTRIKLLEDRIMQLEREYPPWAALNFNQPNRQLPPPSATIISRNVNNEIISNVASTTLGKKIAPKLVSMHPPTANPAVDVRTNLPNNLTQQAFKLSRTPRPIKPKGRGRGQTSLTRTIMEQLRPIQCADIEQKDNGLVLNGPTEKSLLNEPTEKSLLNEPTEKSLLNEPTEKCLLNEPPEKSLLNEPTEKSLLNEPTEKSLLIEPTEESLLNEPTEKSLLNEPTEKSLLNEPTEKSC
ncbi:1599_t:CDS:10, partial [Cetraspora pellucida]